MLIGGGGWVTEGPLHFLFAYLFYVSLSICAFFKHSWSSRLFSLLLVSLE
jgi:hypothetical protein